MRIFNRSLAGGESRKFSVTGVLFIARKSLDILDKLVELDEPKAKVKLKFNIRDMHYLAMKRLSENITRIKTQHDNKNSAFIL